MAPKFSKIILAGLPVALVVYLFLPNNRKQFELVPTIAQTSLADSIPIEYYRQLIVIEKQGNKIYKDGKAVTYLEYDTDATALLKTIGNLPFSMHAKQADTICIETGFYQFNSQKESISAEELSVGSYFWNIQPDNYQLYECIKGYEKHTLLISKNSAQVLHRIEYQS